MSLMNQTVAQRLAVCNDIGEVRGRKELVTLPDLFFQPLLMCCASRQDLSKSSHHCVSACLANLHML